MLGGSNSVVGRTYRIQMKRAPLVGWRARRSSCNGCRLPHPRGWHSSRWLSWVSSASAASCAPPAARLRARSNGWPRRWRSLRWRSHVWRSFPSAGLLTPSVTLLMALALLRAVGRLRAGIRLTIVALILAVIAALSGWWPAPASSAAVAPCWQRGGRGHRHHRPSLVRPAGQRASRCHQRPYCQRHHYGARSGHRRSQSGWAVPVGRRRNRRRWSSAPRAAAADNRHRR